MTEICFMHQSRISTHNQEIFPYIKYKVILFVLEMYVPPEFDINGQRCVAAFWSFMNTSQYSIGLLVKQTGTDFISFNSIRHLAIQRCTQSIDVWSFLGDSTLLSPIARIAVSSANVETIFGLNVEYRSSKFDSNIPPCFTPAWIFFWSAYASFQICKIPKFLKIGQKKIVLSQ